MVNAWGQSPHVTDKSQTEIGSTDTAVAAKITQEKLLAEFHVIFGKAKKRNPDLNERVFIDKLLWELKTSWDPRVRFLKDLIDEKIPAHEADQALEVMENITAVRGLMHQALIDEENEHFPTWLGPREWHKLKWSVMHFHDNEDDIALKLSVKERARLTKTINVLILGNISLMLWGLFPWLQKPISELYGGIEGMAWWLVAWDHVISLAIISVFGYEAAVKIKEVWLKKYIQFNKWDIFLNTLAGLEVWIIGYEVFQEALHSSISWLISAGRAIRLIKPLSQIKSLKGIISDITEVAPFTLKLSGGYVAYSTMIMLILTQIGKWQIPELSSIWPALNEMRNLFLWDGFQDIMAKLEQHENMDPISKAVWSVVANVYLWTSYLLFPAVMWAIVTDRVNKSGIRLEQIISLVLERVDTALVLLRDIRERLPEKTDKQ